MRQEDIVASRADLVRILEQAVARRVSYHNCGNRVWDLDLYPLHINLVVKKGRLARNRKGVVCFLPMVSAHPDHEEFETEEMERKDRFYVKEWHFPLRSTLLPDIQILRVVVDAYRED